MSTQDKKEKLPHGEHEEAKVNVKAIIAQFDRIPQELRDRKQWLLWKLEHVAGREKPTKVPYQLNGKLAKTTDPRTWSAYGDVVGAWGRGGYSGIGFVFSSADPYTGIDFDDCVEDGWMLKDEVQPLVDTIDSYTELSQSGTGLHIIVKGQLPENSRKRKDGFEVYDRERFFVFTGSHWPGTPQTVEERQEQLLGIINRLFPQENTTRPAAGAPDLDDQRIIELAEKAKNGATFTKLFRIGDLGGDHSRSDLALCNILAFYTQDPIQIDRIFQQSALYRDKWDRPDYKERTIGAALAGLKEVYKGRSETAAGKVIPLRSAFEDFADEDFTDPPAGSRPDFRKSDLGNAERLVHYFGQNLRYCFPFEKWFVYDGSRWMMDDTGKVLKMAQRVSRLIDKEISKETDDDRRKELRKQASMAESTRGVKGMIELAKAGDNIPILPNDLDSDLWKINAANGVIDLKTGRMLPHDRDYLMTKIINVLYDPAAQCPRWESFLQEIIQDPEVLHFLQKAIGYSLTGDTSEQVLFFLHGNGRNGKSVFLNTIQALFAEYAAQTNTDTFMVKQSNGGANNDIARLKGARLITASESEDGKRLAESLIKQLTGGEPITARFLHREFFTYQPEFKIFFATNHKPRIRGTDLAIWRRIHLIPFTVTIPDEQQDRNLAAKLRDELPGILRWAVQGCLNWQSEGLEPPAAVRAATEEYKAEMDTISDFIEDRLTIDKRAQIRNSELMMVYSSWCERNNEFALSKNVFLQKLAEYLTARGHYVEKCRIGHDRARGLQGVGLPYPEFSSDPVEPDMDERS